MVTTSVLFVLSLVLCNSLHETWIGPFGVKQCQYRCSRLCECTSVVYTLNNLTCHLIDNDGRTVRSGRYVNSTEIQISNETNIPEKAKGSMKCTGKKTCVILQTRRSSKVCVLTNSPNRETAHTKQIGRIITALLLHQRRTSGKSSPKHGRNTNAKKTEKETGAKGHDWPQTRLLMIARENSPDAYRQLNLHNGSIQPFIGLNLLFIQTVFHSAILNRLIVSVPDKIYLVPLDCPQNGKVFKQDMMCGGLAEDKQQNIIFFSIVSFKHSGVYKMEKSDSIFRHVIPVTQKSNQNIAVDSTRQVIFICYQKVIASCDYFGKQRNVLVKEERRNHVFSQLTFDNINNVIYFKRNGKEIFKMDLIRNVTKNVASLKYYIRDLVYYGSHIYSSFYANDHSIAMITLPRTVEYLTTGNKYKLDKVPWVSICVVP